MPIALLTGSPGNGKTHELVGFLGDIVALEGRQVYHNGIPGLKLDWLVCDPTKWYELPDNSVVVIDEAQKIFPVPKAGSERPRHVRELETHRHRGFDFVIATQHPGLIDSHVRRLCQPHIHVERVFGLQQCKRMMWEVVQDNIDYHARKNAQIKIRRFSPDVYAKYQSATHHTIKRRIPFKIWLMVSLLVLLAVIVALGIWQFKRMASGEAAAEARGVDPKATGSPSASGKAYQGTLKLLTTEEYISSFTPRIPNLPHSAPRYDALTAPRVVPIIMGCHMEFYTPEQRCQCLTQQGTIADVTREYCVRWLYGGRPFLDFVEPDRESPRRVDRSAPNRVSLDAHSSEKPDASPPGFSLPLDPFAKPPTVAQ